MDELLKRRDDQAARYRSRRWMPFLLFFAGFPFIVLDLVLGYNCLTFSLVSCGLWIAAAVAFTALMRARPGAQFAPQYQTAREIIHTLRDDLNPKRDDLFGQLDLTGIRQPTKLTREAPNAAGLKVQYYRDEWLGLKGKLYDGNMLRLSVIDWDKVRTGYFKRSRVSGKNKWKAEKSKTGHELRVRISVNPQAYDIKPTPEMRQGAKVGAYAISAIESSGGIINLAAVAPVANITSADVLGVLHATYGLLQRKATSPAA
ncbi:MAG: hypothetical protein HZB53_22085 [Chloroflexi bacterium]|nr:hypothetical protein [Chloroflexota bacterium]